MIVSKILEEPGHLIFSLVYKQVLKHPQLHRFSLILRLLMTLMRTQRLKGRVMKTRSQEKPKRIQPQTPMLWLVLSSAGGRHGFSGDKRGDFNSLYNIMYYA